MTFELRVPNTGSTWRFTGRLDGRTMGRTHTLTAPGIPSFTGSWSATRR